MSSSLRYFTVTSASDVVGQPDVLTRVRLGDNLPFANALVFIPEGQQIPGAPIGTFAPFGGTFVINQAFLPVGTGDLLSAFARLSLAAPVLSAIIPTGGLTASAPIPFDNNDVLKGFTIDGTGAVVVDNAGYYRVNATLDARDIVGDFDVTITVETVDSTILGSVYTPVPQGSFTIVGTPTIESLNIDVFTGALSAGDGIHILATITASGGVDAVPVAAPTQFTIGAGSFFEVNYLGTAPASPA